MGNSSKGVFGRIALLTVVVGLVGALFAATASANNLDRQTAQNAAKFAAKKECQATSGCTGYGASNVVLLTHHKANAKIFVNSTKNGQQFQCRQQVVIRLDHETGDIRYFTSRRRCENLRPA